MSLFLEIFSYPFLDRWYIGTFLAVMGAYWFIRASHLNDIHKYFCDDLSNAMSAAIARRQALEQLPLLTYQIPGVISVVLGVATLFAAMPGILAYALTCASLVASLAIAFSGLRNGGERRAAVLEPRRITAVIWPGWLIIGPLAAFAPLALMDIPSLRIAAVLCTLCSLIAYVLASRLNAMPAIMTGDDPAAELEVEATVRDARMNGLFKTGMAAPFVFVVLAVSPSAMTLQHLIAYWIVMAVFLGMMWPRLFGTFRSWFTHKAA